MFQLHFALYPGYPAEKCNWGRMRWPCHQCHLQIHSKWHGAELNLMPLFWFSRSSGKTGMVGMVMPAINREPAMCQELMHFTCVVSLNFQSSSVVRLLKFHFPVTVAQKRLTHMSRAPELGRCGGS